MRSESLHEKLLLSYNIEPTANRKLILKIILSRPDSQFTAIDIQTLIKQEGLFVPVSSIGKTLKLFKNIGLIKEYSQQKNSHNRGRPKTRFISSYSGIQ